MSEPQIIIVKQEKSMAIAYILLIFLGGFGLHRFYLGRIGTGITQLVLYVIGWATFGAVVGVFFLVVVWLWLIVDLFLTAGMVNAENVRMRTMN